MIEFWIDLDAGQMRRLPDIVSRLQQSTADNRMMPDVIAYRMANHGTSSIAGCRWSTSLPAR